MSRSLTQWVHVRDAPALRIVDPRCHMPQRIRHGLHLPVAIVTVRGSLPLGIDQSGTMALRVPHQRRRGPALVDYRADSPLVVVGIGVTSPIAGFDGMQLPHTLWRGLVHERHAGTASVLNPSQTIPVPTVRRPLTQWVLRRVYVPTAFFPCQRGLSSERICNRGCT